MARPSFDGDCSYETRFTVSVVEPDRYELLWVLGSVSPLSTYALLSSGIPFKVTS